MKRFNRHGLIALIVSSLVLLAVFQVFWIQKVYDEQLSSLRKDLDHAFRSTVMGMQDSMIQCNLGDLPKLPSDSAPLPIASGSARSINGVGVTPPPTQQHSEIHEPNSHQNKISFVQKDGIKITVSSDSLSGREIARMVSRAYLNKPTPADSIMRMARMMEFDEHRNDSTFRNRRRELHFFSDSMVSRVYFRSGDSLRVSYNNHSKDSLSAKKGIAQVVIKSTINNTKPTKDSNIFIKLDLDSLKIEDIAVHYWMALLNQKIDLPFRIHRLHQSQLPPPQYQGITTMPVFAGMPRFNVYVAQFPEYQSFVFKKTLPQILFSLLLFGMTALAFGLVYRSLRQQERLTALKNDFISNITHELKTPIATVSVAIEALQNFNALQKPELTKEYLDISKNELSRLSMLVDKVLKLSVFEQKEPELKKEIIDLASLVAQVLDSMRLQFEKLGVKIAFDTEGADHTFVEADKTHLTSVIYNLLDNAIKYDGKNVNIQFATDQNALKMSIEDDGCGIASEYQAKIFDKFFRVPKGDIHNVKGYGLGLSYVASIVKQHGGRIEVQSVLEKGSTFSVFLPKK
jgi:signal transduction histidine kinase